MFKKFILVAILVSAMATGSAFAGDLLQLVPEDTSFVFNINLGKIISTEMVKKQITDGMAKQTPEQKKAYDEFIAKTGVDPLKDLTQIVVFVAGKIDPKSEKQEAGVLVDGNFDPAKIIEAIKKDEKAAADVEIIKFKGFDAIKGKKESDGMGVFLDNKTALIGTNPALEAVVGVKSANAKNLSANAAVGALLKKVDTNSSLWGVGLIPQNLKDQAKANPQAAPLAAVNALFFSFNYDNNITFNFCGEIDKKENMAPLETSLQGFLAMIKMFAGNTPEAGEILNMVKIECADTTAKVSLNVSKEKLDEVRKKIEERIKSGGGMPGQTPAPAPGTK